MEDITTCAAITMAFVLGALVPLLALAVIYMNSLPPIWVVREYRKAERKEGKQYLQQRRDKPDLKD